MPRTKTARKTARPKAAKIVAIKPNRLVWDEAMRLAKGDASRIQVLSETECRVLN